MTAKALLALLIGFVRCCRCSCGSNEGRVLLLIDLVSCLSDADTPDLLIMRGHNCLVKAWQVKIFKSRSGQVCHADGHSLQLSVLDDRFCNI